MIIASDLFKTPSPGARSVGGMAPTFNAIGLAVADMATSLAFYRRLGLDFPAGSDQEPHAEAVVAGGIRLMWDTHASLRHFDPDYRPGPPGGGWAFQCADPGEVDSVHAELVAAGHPSVKAPWDTPWGQRYAQAQDPDGNVVDLFAWLKNPG
jgi:catechol 2,3-dioxygenase-like lactoylglutathione lyase family enzyme